MDLLCSEGIEKHAYKDPVLQKERVLHNLLVMEENYLPNRDYFTNVQHEIKPSMRCIVTNWMLDVCHEENCNDQVFPLAVNYLDRFLSMVSIRKIRLQLVGSVCLFLASKLKDRIPLTAEKLCSWTDYSVTCKELLDWELLLLEKLKWDMGSVTPLDFLDQILYRLSFELKDIHMLKKHSYTLIALCCTDFQLCTNPPSMIAGGCILCALAGVLPQNDNSIAIVNGIVQKITGIEPDYLICCKDQVEDLLSKANLSHKIDEIDDNSDYMSETPTDLDSMQHLVA